MTFWIERVLGLEMAAILGLFAAAVWLQLLTGRISLRGLLREKDGSRRMSWARVQLLIATLATAGYVARATWTAATGRLPQLSLFWIFLMGASSALYLARKACGRALSKVR